jgi:predicted nucleic acid-binding protein
VAEAHAELTRLRGLLAFLDDTPGVFAEWERLVVRHQVSGKSAHDVRLVAVMIVHGIDRLLTFNCGDFQRFPGITVLSPTDVLDSKPSSP